MGELLVFINSQLCLTMEAVPAYIGGEAWPIQGTTFKDLNVSKVSHVTVMYAVIWCHKDQH